MLRTLAVENYRSLQHLTVELSPLTVITGPNGSGKSNLYRALRLLSDVVRDGALQSLAAEGGLRSALYAGSRNRGAPVALRLGFAADELSYAIDLGLPSPGVSPFPLDPEVKSEAVWVGAVLRPGTIAADRRSLRVRVRGASGQLETAPWSVHATESMLATLADPDTAPELFALRERARNWRFFDALRTDPDAPARRPGPATFTPVLSGDGGNLPGALATLLRVGNAEALQKAVGDAFDGATAVVDEDDRGIARVGLHQPGVQRSFEAAELSDGTLRFLLLATALLAARPPGLLVLNEPEASLHPRLLPALAGLIALAAKQTQVVIVSHAEGLVRALRDDAAVIQLEREDSATLVHGQLPLEAPAWSWPAR
jgi:predicted ATPase